MQALKVRDLLEVNLLSSLGTSNRVDILPVALEQVISYRNIILHIKMSMSFSLVIISREESRNTAEKVRHIALRKDQGPLYYI